MPSSRAMSRNGPEGRGVRNGSQPPRSTRRPTGSVARGRDQRGLAGSRLTGDGDAAAFPPGGGGQDGADHAELVVAFEQTHEPSVDRRPLDRPLDRPPYGPIGWGP